MNLAYKAVLYGEGKDETVQISLHKIEKELKILNRTTVQLIKADSHVGFYELFILCVPSLQPPAPPPVLKRAGKEIEQFSECRQDKGQSEMVIS